MNELPRKVGLIGIGLLGTAIAERIARDHPIMGFDLDPSRHTVLRQLGAEVASSAAQVAAACREIVLCLPDSDVVRKVTAGLDQVLVPGSTIIDTTTGDPAITVELSNRYLGLSVAWIDATIAGSSHQVRNGEALALVGGESNDVERVAVVLSSIVPRHVHVGPVGAGSKMKLVVNLVIGLHRAVLAEGLAFAGACGLDPASTLGVLMESAAYSRAMDAKGTKMIEHDFAPQARLRQHLKDVRLILAAGEQHGAKLPLSTVHAELLQALHDMGYGGEDNSAILRACL